MKAKSIIHCAVILLVFQSIALAQKTEVSVRKGKVIAETPATSVAVEAGRKAVLSPDKNPSVTVDDPLVDDVMEIYKWVEAEKQAQREKIDTSSIQVIKIENEHLFTIAYYAEIQNKKSEPSNTCVIEDVSILDEPSYYDLQGNLLRFDLEKINATSGTYTVSYPYSVDPGRNFKYICVSKIIPDEGVLKEGPLRYIQAGWNVPNCLNYFRFILPASAIFVDSNRPVTIMDTVEGRVAVTIRSYTGSFGDGTYQIAFLWPDKDGTTLADLPPKYRGLRDQSEEEIVQEGRRRTAEILAGGTYSGQKTPLETLLSLYSAVVHKSTAQFLELIRPDLRQFVNGQMDQFMGAANLLVNFQFLGTPTWPDKPANGYEHPVYLCREGSQLCEVTVTMAHQDGKWYLKSVEAGRRKTEGTDSADNKAAGGVTISKNKTDLSAATYEDLKPGQFMRRWLFLGPIHVPWEGEGYFPDEEASNKFFDTKSLDLDRFEPKVGIAGNDYEWTSLYSEYGVIDLTAVFDKWFVVAYVWAQVEMPEQTDAVLGIGSDDCIKVWLNSTLVHEHRGGRGVIPDSDCVPVTFKKGKNQLVLKILNYGGPWGFACRLLETK
jgi:hypothetical protein